MILATATQQAIWARMKAENHPGYVYVLQEAKKDNTSAMRYASMGRWSALAYVMSGDKQHARRAYDTQNAIKKDWLNAAVLAGNDMREFGTELVVMLDWIRPELTEAEFQNYFGWLTRSTENIFKVGNRMGDSDQTVGNYFMCASMDRAFGTTYGTRVLTEQMRDAVVQFCTQYGRGGQWPESSDYNLGTVWLLCNGAETCDIKNYPEVAAFRAQYAKLFMQQWTPDLKDTFEWGDEQTPNEAPWYAVEDLCAHLGHHFPEIRGLEDDLRVVKNKPYGPSFYSRYYTWADVFGPRPDWQTFAGDFLVADGVGQVYARTGWTPDDAALMAWFPSFSIGELDHCYSQWGTFRVYDHGKFTVDHPGAYSNSVELQNQVVLAGIGASTEVGVLTGSAHHPGKLTYASGTNAGLNVEAKYYQPPPTYRHEQTRSIFRFWDRKLTLVLDRVHVEDPKLLPLLNRYSTAIQARMAANPLIQTLWHSQVVEPLIVNGTIEGDSLIRPLYPCDMTVIDMAAMNVGTITPKEKKWYVSVVPKDIQLFQVLATVIGYEPDVTVSIARLGDVHRVLITKEGFPDVWIYSSALPGPKLATSIATNQWGGTSSFHDPSKIDGILLARTLVVTPTTVNGDIVIESADGITYIPAKPPVPPNPPLVEWAITSQSPSEITLERGMDARARISRRTR